ncbi:hypothetical protein IWQ57_004068 [Coemansia nantahalensis]|uniref:Uncharacterized protein n=2 Tax=Coemansia TaxID=4863 RepID=A0ACC1JU88_9FUNG|nr:hypothetical protein IWQ57_004068 [Coemansia nantahalensis]
MLYLWFAGCLFLGTYNTAQELNIGLLIQPQLFAFFTLANILQVYWHGYKWSIARVGTAAALLCGGYVGISIGVWKAEKLTIENHHDAATTFLGVLPAILIAVGFFPQFYVSFKQRSMEMANLFLALDAMGGVFSTISLVFGRTFDYVASITYLVVVLFDIVLALMKLYFYVRGTQGAVARTATSTPRESTSDKSSHTPPFAADAQDAERSPA